MSSITTDKPSENPTNPLIDNYAIVSQLREYSSSIRQDATSARPGEDYTWDGNRRTIGAINNFIFNRVQQDPDKFSLYRHYQQCNLRGYRGIGPLLEPIVREVIRRLETLKKNQTKKN